MFLTESRLRVVAESGVVRAEVAQREAVQVPAVRGIAEGAEVRVMRRSDVYGATRTKEAVELLHSADDVGDVLDHMNRAHVIEALVTKRVREPVHVHQHVGGCAGNAVDPH